MALAPCRDVAPDHGIWLGWKGIWRMASAPFIEEDSVASDGSQATEAFKSTWWPVTVAGSDC